MKKYAHRINSIKEMEILPKYLGAEFDVREYHNSLIVSHDPFSGGEQFDEFINVLTDRHLIVNVKCEGIEERIINLLEKKGIKNYFLLDCSFPAILKLINRGFDKIALRYSEYEGMDTLKKMQGKAQWVWIDCFTKIPFNARQFNQIKHMGYKICLVSPDLLSRPEQIPEYLNYLNKIKCIPDAVCVKRENHLKWIL